MKNCIVLCFIFIFTSVLSAQETQWMFDLNGISSGQPVVCRGIDGNIILANFFNRQSNGSFNFKGANITVANSTNAGNLILTSITPDSTLVWAFSTDVTTNNTSINPVDIVTDELGNIYLLISYNATSLGNITFSSNISLSYNRTGRRNAIIKI